MSRPVARALCLSAVLGLFLSACWPFGGGSARAYMEGRYSLEPLPRSWSGVNPGGADEAWWHESTGATLYTDSNCEKGYSDSSLERLARAQSAAIDDPRMASETTFRLAGREAYTAHFLGQVDGVPVAVTTTVLKKAMCIYDFVLVAPISGVDSLLPDYEAFVASFRIKK
jgi:hypothetical protein